MFPSSISNWRDSRCSAIPWRASPGMPASAGSGGASIPRLQPPTNPPTPDLNFVRPRLLGGASRQESVLNGLESLVEQRPRHVLVHDAARPFVTAAIIDRTLAALDEAPGAVVAVPVTDTLKRTTGENVAGTIERAGL